MKIKSILSIFVIICLCSCSEPNWDFYADIDGKVLDDNTSEPVENVLVTLSPSGKNATTDADGCFEFRDLEARQYTVTVQKVGYSTNRKTINAISGENELTITITRNDL